ncbi:MAG: hypothetical protein HZA54_02145 [Planctomycetes bacterium]|nr:hypothetical protein [Planctomycetota bacterium]
MFEYEYEYEYDDDDDDDEGEGEGEGEGDDDPDDRENGATPTGSATPVMGSDGRYATPYSGPKRARR